MFIDADVHHYVNSIRTLLPYLPLRWQRYVEESGFQGPAASPYPKGSPFAARIDAAPPNGGIPAGGSATFTFSLTGSGLDALTTASFLAALSSPEGQDLTPAFFVARFRGFPNGGSDKVPGQSSGGGGGGGGIQNVPEPGTMTLAALGIASALGYGWRRRRARALQAGG